jgi:hypothetical protein
VIEFCQTDKNAFDDAAYHGQPHMVVSVAVFAAAKPRRYQLNGLRGMYEACGTGGKYLLEV